MSSQRRPEWTSSSSDFATIGVLVVLEGLLSADNALVLAVMILGLPRGEQKKALRYGLVGAFAFRIARDRCSRCT